MKIDIEVLKQILRDAKNGFIKDIENIEMDGEGWLNTDFVYYALIEEEEEEE